MAVGRAVSLVVVVEVSTFAGAAEWALSLCRLSGVVRGANGAAAPGAKSKGQQIRAHVCFYLLC